MRRGLSFLLFQALAHPSQTTSARSYARPPLNDGREKSPVSSACRPDPSAAQLSSISDLIVGSHFTLKQQGALARAFSMASDSTTEPKLPVYTIPPAENKDLGPIARLVLPRIFKLYDCTAGAKEFEVYNKDATFEDPLMKAIGVKQIKSAFYSMHIFSELGIKQYSVVETQEAGPDSGKLVVDNIQHYKLWGRDFDMVSRINLTVKDGLVTSHQDLWDRKPLSTPDTSGISGSIAQGCRRASMMITHAIMGFGRDVKPREC